MNAKFKELINSPAPVLVDFFAEWCGPCKMMTPQLQQLKAKLGDDLSIIKIDVDKNAALQAHFKIQGVPTLMLFQNGKQLWRQSGYHTATQLEQIIKQKAEPQS
jgi:thioredoxin 1